MSKNEKLDFSANYLLSHNHFHYKFSLVSHFAFKHTTHLNISLIKQNLNRFITNKIEMTVCNVRRHYSCKSFSDNVNLFIAYNLIVL